VCGDEAARRIATATLVHLQARLLQTVAVRAQLELAEMRGDGPFGQPLADGRSLRLHQIALPTLLGRRALAFRGTEFTAIRTMLPEIAQEASISAPFVETRQSGLWLQVLVPDGQGTDAIQLDVQSDEVDPSALRALGPAGALHLADTTSLRASHLDLLPAGRDVSIATGIAFARNGQTWRPTLTVRRAPATAEPRTEPR
jgi:hypothetical protein